MCRAEKAWDWWYTELQKKIIITFSEYWTSWAGKSRLYDLDIYIEQVKHILKSTGVCRIDKALITNRWPGEEVKTTNYAERKLATVNDSHKEEKDNMNTVCDRLVPEHKLVTYGTWTSL